MYKLRHFRPEVLAFLRTCPQPWGPSLVRAVETMLDANERRAAAAAKQTHSYSGDLRERIADAWPARLIGEPRAAAVVRQRIERIGPEKFGLRRTPDIATIRSVGRELEKLTREAVIESRFALASRVPPALPFTTMSSTRNTT